MASQLLLLPNILKKLISLIKKTFGYQERDVNKRDIFKKKIATISAKNLVYIDESGIRKNEAIIKGWSKKGQRLHDLRCGSRNLAINIIGALKQGRVYAPFAFEGSCNTDVFNTYLQKILAPKLQKEDVIILDNASFHRASDLAKICNLIGCEYLFLPPYSPDLNKIEHYWHSIKSKLRKLLRDNSKSLMEMITDVFMDSN